MTESFMAGVVAGDKIKQVIDKLTIVSVDAVLSEYSFVYGGVHECRGG
jgi:hypothetical protein